MLVNDMRVNKNTGDDFIVAVLFDNNKNNSPCKVLKFKRGTRLWVG